LHLKSARIEAIDAVPGASHGADGTSKLLDKAEREIIRLPPNVECDCDHDGAIVLEFR